MKHSAGMKKNGTRILAAVKQNFWFMWMSQCFLSVSLRGSRWYYRGSWIVTNILVIHSVDCDQTRAFHEYSMIFYSTTTVSVSVDSRIFSWDLWRITHYNIVRGLQTTRLKRNKSAFVNLKLKKRLSRLGCPQRRFPGRGGTSPVWRSKTSAASLVKTANLNALSQIAAKSTTSMS